MRWFLTIVFALYFFLYATYNDKAYSSGLFYRSIYQYIPVTCIYFSSFDSFEKRQIVRFVSNIYRNTRDTALSESAKYRHRRILPPKGKIKKIKRYSRSPLRGRIRYDGNYTYASDYDTQPRKQLVFFTSAETHNQTKLSYDVHNHLRMYAHFQNHFNFKAIVFSRSPLIASVCAEYNITVVDHYETNPFGIPLIRDLFLQSYYLVNSRFYGYVNGDIVLSPVLFTFLTEVERQIHRGEIPANMEIAGRVFDTVYKGTLPYESRFDYLSYLYHCSQHAVLFRNPFSADYFILPDVFDFSLIKDVVIGREKIDNYMMSLMYDYRGYLIDTTEKIIAFHLGKVGYKQKFKKFNQTLDNFQWNFQYVHKQFLLKGGSLQFAAWKAVL